MSGSTEGPRRVEIQPRAQVDLENILLYTGARWGQDQRRTYRIILTRAIEEIGRHPEIGRQREEVSPRCRSALAGEHVVYYQIDGETVNVLRVLHHRQDAASEVSD